MIKIAMLLCVLSALALSSFMRYNALRGRFIFVQSAIYVYLSLLLLVIILALYGVHHE